jgi:hypothetical protein
MPGLVPAAVVGKAEPEGECLTGDSRGARRHLHPLGRGHAAAGSAFAARVAANAAGERIPSELCGLHWL